MNTDEYFKCSKCGFSEVQITYYQKFTEISNNIIKKLENRIYEYLNMDGLGKNKEVWHEFLLCKCKTCGAYFFKDTLDNLKD